MKTIYSFLLIPILIVIPVPGIFARQASQQITINVQEMNTFSIISNEIPVFPEREREDTRHNGDTSTMGTLRFISNGSYKKITGEINEQGSFHVAFSILPSAPDPRHFEKNTRLTTIPQLLMEGTANSRNAGFRLSFRALELDSLSLFRSRERQVVRFTVTDS